jgi:hypothetical protein
MPPRAVLAALLALAAPAWPQSPPSLCTTLESCLALVGTPMRDSESMAFHARIQSFGPAAVAALLARLDVPNSASAAGLELAQFPTIDPRHLPSLIRAYERGNGWMPRAIAATGTDEAVAYLEAQFLKNPDFSNNAQVHFALAKLGDRVRPFILAQLEACRNGAPRERCQGVFSVLGGVGHAIPEWAIEPLLALATAPAADEAVRRSAGNIVIHRRHPLGLDILASRLETDASTKGDRWELERTIGQIGDYGAEAMHLGPRIVPFLASDDPKVQAEAALALGRIGSRSGAAELIALEPRFEDDWILAYDSVEALGRMGAGQARPLLERVAAGHWHRAVRNNAARALNRLTGGEFERAGVVGDGAPYPQPQGPDGEQYYYFGELRYAGDVPAPCALDPTVTVQPLRQDPPAAISWPASGAQRLEFQPLPDRIAGQVRATLSPGRTGARVAFRLPTPSGGFLAGYDEGEWGGGVVHVGADGTVAYLVDGNARGAFRIGRRVYVIHGLSHMTISEGKVSVFAGDPPRLLRATRLPSEPYEILATDRHAVLVRTRTGDLAIREDGRLADPESLGLCAKRNP